MDRLISFTINESDMEWTLLYTKQTVNEAFRKLVDDLGRQYHTASARPYCVALGGPPGCGKSATAAVFRDMLMRSGIVTIVLPVDGFHMRNEELKTTHIVRNGRSVPLYALKGAPETYAADRLQSCLARLRAGEKFYWPIYSRITHEPEEEGILIENSQALYIIEGNYLLLQKEPWTRMSAFFDKAIYIHSQEKLLKKRIVMRKKRGGYSGMYARRHFKQSDRCNINEVLTHSGAWDYQLLHTGKYRYELR